MPLLRKGRRKTLFQTDRWKGVGASLCGDIINKKSVCDLPPFEAIFESKLPLF